MFLPVAAAQVWSGISMFLPYVALQGLPLGVPVVQSCCPFLVVLVYFYFYCYFQLSFGFPGLAVGVALV